MTGNIVWQIEEMADTIRLMPTTSISVNFLSRNAYETGKASKNCEFLRNFLYFLIN